MSLKGREQAKEGEYREFSMLQPVSDTNTEEGLWNQVKSL